jgi:glycosyltransferase involved in cell wall biosynthesis
MLLPLRMSLEIGISRQVADNLNRRPVAHLLGRKSLYIPNALDLQRFGKPRGPEIRESKRRELGLPLGAFLAITVGRLAPQKGYPVLLEAVTPVLAEMPAAHFLIVGSGEQETALQERARDRGLGQAVRFLGLRPDVEDLLAAADLFVSSSLWEGLPTVILESMAARLPVVATDVSGTRDIVEDGVTGLLVPPRDPGALAEAILDMSRDRARAERMAERARQRVSAFSIANVAQQHMKVYRRLLEAQ